MSLTIGIVGLGLIGGSLARAVKKYTGASVLGMDVNHDTIREALEEGAIDEAITPSMLSRADILFLCLYPKAAVEFAEKNGAQISKEAVVCDVAGIKGWICEKMPPLAEKFGFTYIGTHPMAGKERNGFSASDADLFQGASFLMVPGGAEEKKVETLKRLAGEIGFSGVVVTTPEEHDRMIAFTSQLPHVLACAYVLSPCCENHRGFSAGSYRDVSRVARINETLWTELFLENRGPLVEELDLLLSHLSELRNAIEEGRKEELTQLLRRGRLVKEALGE